MKTLPLMTIAALTLGTCLTASADPHPSLPAAAYDSDHGSAIAAAVRAATAKYRDINVARAAGYVVPATTCVSGPDHGAMGIHWANPAYLMNPPFTAANELDPSHPAILIYEPQADGSEVLVGVEYVLPLPLWIARDPGNNDPANPPARGAAVPSVDGHLMNYQAQPNRYGVGNSFYLHIWAWRYNPDGLFADWNRTVSCAKQSPSQPPVS
ncbi:MAG TPA: hypothetical protein VFX20_01005 [Steroidobacteraceae bacterium]|nr:hypothetical protein [Steroidobacteraceae bacterium]